MNKMRYHWMLLALSLWSIGSFAFDQTVLSCPMQNCKDCQLLIDVKDERAEYMDNESSHFLAQMTKDVNQRIFEAAPVQEIPSLGLRLIFSRKNKTADLIEISFADKSEKYRYKNLKCKFTALTLTPVR